MTQLAAGLFGGLTGSAAQGGAAGPSGVGGGGDVGALDNRSTNVIQAGGSFEGITNILKLLNSAPPLLGGSPTLITPQGDVVNRTTGIPIVTIGLVIGAAVLAIYLLRK